MAYTRGQAPVTRAAAEDVSRAATWVLLEPVDQPAQLKVWHSLHDAATSAAGTPGSVQHNQPGSVTALLVQNIDITHLLLRCVAVLLP